MTDLEEPSSEPSAPHPTGITLSRSTLAVIGVSVLAVIVVAVITTAAVTSAAIVSAVPVNPSATQPAVEESVSPTVAVTPEAVAMPTPVPVVVSSPVPLVNRIGDAVVNFGVTLTVHSVEAMATVPVISGDPIAGEPGTQLYLIKTTFVNNTKVPVDLSCSGAVWMKIYDTNARRLAPIFETRRIAGNPACNYLLVQGLSHEWNFVFKGVAGATLDRMTFLDTDARQAGDPDEATISLR